MVISCCWSRATSPWSSPRNKYIKHVRLDTVGRPVRKEAGRPFFIASGASPRPTRSDRINPSCGFRCIPPAGHGMVPHRTRANPYHPMYQPPAGLRGRRPSHRNNAEHGLSALPHPFRTTAPNQINIPTYKSFTRFFSCEGCPPPVCLRCSPGLFRHGGGAASCHTSSMAAKPHLALTKNSSPTTLANGRRATQIAESRGQRPRSPVATGEIPAPRKARNTRWPQRAKLPRSSLHHRAFLV